MKILRSDNGTEYVNSAISKWTVEIGLIHEISCVYTPQQNGTSEVGIKALTEGA